MGGLAAYRVALTGRIGRGSFARNVATLVSGTALAQALPILVSPVLTRLFDPSEFGILAIYLSCLSVLAVIVTWKYDQAITLPRTDTEAANIVLLALKVCALVSLSLYIPVVIWGRSLSVLMGNEALAGWLFLLPVSVGATGVFNVFQFWQNRRSDYRFMAAGRLLNAATGVTSNVILGVSKAAGGLIIGATVGQLVSAAWAAALVRRRDRDAFEHSSRFDQWRLARRYLAHPLHIAPSQLIGVLATHIPVIVISSVFSPATAGFFWFAYRLVSLPTGLIANAIGDVYRQKISEAYRERGEFRVIFLKTIVGTVAAAFVPFAIMYFASPMVFSHIFGDEWRVAGDYARVLSISAFLQFILTPVDKGALVVGATRYIFAWQLARLVMVASMAFLANAGMLSAIGVLWGLVIINAILYLVDGFAEYVLSRGVKAGPFLVK